MHRPDMRASVSTVDTDLVMQLVRTHVSDAETGLVVIEINRSLWQSERDVPRSVIRSWKALRTVRTAFGKWTNFRKRSVFGRGFHVVWNSWKSSSGRRGLPVHEYDDVVVLPF